MPKKSAPKKTKLSDPEQSKRFVATAKAIGADEDPKAFDKVFKKVTVPPKGA